MFMTARAAYSHRQIFIVTELLGYIDLLRAFE